MKSVKRFFSTIARKIGADEEENNENLLKPFRAVKKEDQGPKEDQTKVHGATDNSPEDLLKPFRSIKREGQGPEKKRKTEKRRDEAETDVSLKVQSVKAQQHDTCATSSRPVLDVDKSVAKSVSAASVVEDLSSRSLRRLRDISERAVRKVKTFVSRPIKEATMKRFVTKVEARKQAEMSGQIPLREVKRGDDVFPKQRLRKSQEACRSKEAINPSAGANLDMSLKSVAYAVPSSRRGDLPSGNMLVYGNKNNNGKLMINDEPFWTQQKKPTEADLEESGTEDDIQLNAEIALEVYEGKAKLVNMPAIPIILDPMNELSELKRRDKLFYTKEVLFGNSVRSMINLCDNSTKVTTMVRRRGQPEVTFKEPETMYSYVREHATEAVKLPFTPRTKDISRRSSRRMRKKRISAKACEFGSIVAGVDVGVRSGKLRKTKRSGEGKVVAESETQDGGKPKERESSAKSKSRQVIEHRSPPHSVEIR